MNIPPQEQQKKNPLALPSPEVLRDIAAKQNARAQAIRARRAQELQLKLSVSNKNGRQETAAAQVIQRNYRGYRERRELKGWGVSGGDRRLEVMKLHCFYILHIYIYTPLEWLT